MSINPNQGAEAGEGVQPANVHLAVTGAKSDAEQVGHKTYWLFLETNGQIAEIVRMTKDPYQLRLRVEDAIKYHEANYSFADGPNYALNEDLIGLFRAALRERYNFVPKFLREVNDAEIKIMESR